MKKFRVGVVGLGHRGRLMFKLAADSFDCVIPAAACDLFERNFYEKQWLMDAAMSELYPDVTFYKDYDEMLEKANLGTVIKKLKDLDRPHFIREYFHL